ncbi:hypothetical protein B0T19DRAFT_9223 [Cercophora scortea]|uniref:Secreted protein n=1 Tax=Cercophora scortea TaxID=314031 RepID=A0AAE0J2R0_9PEZI|nr:hypothetical protein B0T19DRAFT_9223 [Cercophora scortea]
MIIHVSLLFLAVLSVCPGLHSRHINVKTSSWPIIITREPCVAENIQRPTPLLWSTLAARCRESRRSSSLQFGWHLGWRANIQAKEASCFHSPGT